MPKQKKWLEWTARALDELDNGMTHYAEQNPAAARRMQKEIDSAALSLVATVLPVKGKPGCVPGTRELVLGANTPYILVF